MARLLPFRPRGPSRGASLIEALVALAVMGFGILGIAGIQSTLRSNADLSKQQAEATRLAQRALEESRSFTQIAVAADPDVRTYDGLASDDLGDVVGTNATFSRVIEVVDIGPGRAKRVTVKVGWTDRANQPQQVTLTSNITGMPPEVGASLAVSTVGRPLRQPLGRHAGIPPEAIDRGDGTSQFSPPGGGSARWIFSNTTGVISRICADGTEASCINVQSYLLSGFIRFATGSTAPTGVDAEFPPSPPLSGLGVAVEQTLPVVATVTCFVRTSLVDVEYFCAVPVSDGNPMWSGRALVTGLSLAASVGTTTSTDHRVCRYTRDRAHTVVPAIPNERHPLDYKDVKGTLTGQNYLVIRAGDGTVAFDCPADDPATSLINGNTWHHQPAT